VSNDSGPSEPADRLAALEAAKGELSAAEAALRLALRRVKAAPRADKNNQSVQAAFDNLVKIKNALAALERLASDAVDWPSQDREESFR
jgi:hypothetical protein